MAKIPQYRRADLASSLVQPVADQSADIMAQAMLQATTQSAGTAAQIGLRQEKLNNYAAANSFQQVGAEIAWQQAQVRQHEAAQKKALDAAYADHHFNSIQREMVNYNTELKAARGATPHGTADEFDEYYGKYVDEYMRNNPDLVDQKTGKALRPDIMATIKSKADDAQTEYYKSNSSWELSKDTENLIATSDDDRAKMVVDASNANSGAELSMVAARYQSSMGQFNLSYGPGKAAKLHGDDERDMVKGFMNGIAQKDPQATIDLLNEGYYNTHLLPQEQNSIRNTAESEIKARELQQAKAVEIKDYKDVQGFRKAFNSLDKAAPLVNDKNIVSFIAQGKQLMEIESSKPRDQFNESKYKEMESKVNQAEGLLRTAASDFQRNQNADRQVDATNRQTLDRQREDENRKKTDFTKTPASIETRATLRTSKQRLYETSVGKNPTVTLSDVTRFESALDRAYNNNHFYGKEGQYESYLAFSGAIGDRLQSDKPKEQTPFEKAMAMVIKPAPASLKSAKFHLSPDDADAEFTKIKQAGLDFWKSRHKDRDITDDEVTTIENSATRKFLGLK